uniref:Uncharacterized protein n=1 Tax=Rhipicephalus zambeziensis TaxID=60191 RepID=A0A224YFK5_9ACAR
MNSYSVFFDTPTPSGGSDGLLATWAGSGSPAPTSLVVSFDFSLLDSSPAAFMLISFLAHGFQIESTMGWMNRYQMYSNTGATMHGMQTMASLVFLPANCS